MKNSLSIGIIGGGFCGTMTLVHLIRQAKQPVRITVFNKQYPLARGIAYKTYSDKHLLNVEARNMSAFPDQPDHFVNWCKANNIPPTGKELSTSYMPRNAYGKYLDTIYHEALSQCPAHVTVNIVEEEVVDVLEKENELILETSAGNFLSFNKIVLATGNAVPQDPRLPDNELLHSKLYYGNPWNSAAVAGVENERSVLILGTGLTMVDIVLSLEENGFTGKIVAMSPHGFKILPHRRNHLQRSILDELSPPYRLEEVFRLFYKHVRQARLNGSSGEAVVDAVRSKTQEIWQQLSLQEKKRFMTHLRHMWGVARHRLPKDIHEHIEALIDSGRLQVIAGKLEGAVMEDKTATVQIKMKNGSKMILKVDRLINCTGPQSDIRKQNSLLFKNLLEKKLVHPDPMNLGVHATADGRIMDDKEKISNRIYTLGTLLKGQLWESTAVPELRTQAATTARLLLETLEIKSGVTA